MDAITTTIHVGLDVHKDTIAVSLRRPGAGRPQSWTVGTTAEAVRKLAVRLRRESAGGHVHACYEAGPTGFGVQRILESEGIVCDVVAPSLIPVRPGERRATDRLDADRLSEHLAHGALTSIAVPTPGEEAARDLVRHASRARQELNDCKREILSFLLRLGLTRPAQIQRNWTKPFMAWLLALKPSESCHQLVLEDLRRELRHRQERVDQLTRRVEELAATKSFVSKVNALRCFKGIDTYSGMVLATEIISPERFRGPRQLMSYVGLVVAESSSGLKQRRLGLTKTGNERARRILVEAAHHARYQVGKEGATVKKRRTGQPAWALEIARRAERRLHDRYWGLLKRGKPECKVVAAVARELTGFAWAMLTEVSGREPAPEIDSDGVVLS